MKAEVALRPAQVQISGSADFPEMTLVAYRRGEPATAKVIPAETGVSFAPDGGGSVVVLAVSRALAEAKKGQVDTAWLEPSAPGVVLVGIAEVPSVYRDVLVRYQAVKTEKGPGLKLLNPDELAAAQTSPGTDPSLQGARAEAQSQQLLFWSVGAAAVLVLAGGCWFFLRSRKRNPRPAKDMPS
ncbi:MAG: hypothetical protein K2X82_15975 [Gemmataceae bacterium]|nr:hypothetical protein [Gemmataceae bacterium]